MREEKKFSLINFVNEFFRLWFVDRDFQKLAFFVHMNANFIGLDIREGLFFPFKEIKDDCKVECFGDSSFLVTGILEGLDNGDSKDFTLLCEEKDERYLVRHGHFSGFDDMILGLNSHEKLKISLFKSVADSICGAIQICAYEEDFPIKFISKGFANMVGYSEDEIMDKYEGKHLSLVHPEDRESLVSNIKIQLSKASSFCVEYRLIHKNGDVVWVLDKGIVVEDVDNHVNVHCVLTDITDKKVQEEELIIYKKRYEILLAVSDINMFEYNYTTKELTLFENINQMYNIPDVVKNGVETFVNEGIIERESSKVYLDMYKEVWQGKEKASCLVKTKDKNGDIHDYELSLTAVFNKQGKVERAIGVRRNVTDIMSLKKEREFSKRLAENKEFVIEINITKDRIEYIDSKWKNMVSVDFNTSYNRYIKDVIDFYVAPEHKDYVEKSLSREYVRSQAKLGKFAYAFAYKRKDEKDLKYKWYESTVSIVKDKVTGDTVARIHRENINERKEKEIRAIEEQRRYRHMIDKCLYIFEINYTKDIIYSGHEHWYKRNNKKITNSYSQVIKDFALTNLSKEEGKKFLQIFSRDKIIELFQSGERNYIYECNEILEDGSSRWLECDLHFYEDVSNGDIRCFAYMNDIEQRKSKELKLEFDAEHDAMTGMFNKVKAEEKIDAMLKRKSDKLSALFVVDIDCFKSINDSFGHVFGDEIIKDVAKIIFSVFRHSDIVGRIGGDEFCIFMEGINALEDVKRKAEELRKSLKKTYLKDGKEGEISASIGIAIARDNKCTYQELYINADSALYVAKNSGKNKFQLSE